MTEASLEVLEERVDTLIKKVDAHTIEDDQNFKDVFKLIKRIEITQAKSGVLIAIIVVVAQLVVGAWVKGLF
jgi:uncharacterized protein with PhoU and TrkA domain